MKKNLVKVLTLALAAAMVAGMSAMAMPVSALSDTDTQTITVRDINKKDAGTATVKAYQIVKYNYSDPTNLYELTDIATAAGVTKVDDLKADKIKAETVEDLAKAVTSETTAYTLTKNATDDTVYETTVPGGLYLVIVTGDNALVYNPALVSVNINDKNELVDGTVSMNNAELAYSDGEVYVKSTEPKFNKDILKDGTGVEGDTVAYGDDVSFILNEMNIPSYSDAYTTVTYKIDDTLDAKAFKGVKNVQVYVGGTKDTDKVTAAAGTYTITGVADDSTSFTIAFASDYIKAHAGQSVVVTYDSQFTSPTAINYSEHKNTATLTYSNDPKDASSTNEITDTTYHYTFGIDADLDADEPNSDKNKDHNETYELNKVTKAAAGWEKGTGTKATGTAKDTKKSKASLAGATFSLYTKETCNADEILKIQQADGSMKDATDISDDNGHFSFVGLDEGVYYMKEDNPPAGYSRQDNTIYRITISAEIDKVSGIMSEYTILTALKKGSSYEEIGKATYKNDLSKAIPDDDGNVVNFITVDPMNPVEIVNTPLAELPSTGGEGTIALTVGGAIGMAGFLTLYIANKKKKKAE